MKNLIKNFLIFSFIFLIIAGFLSAYSGQKQKIEKIGVQKMIKEIEDNKVSSITVDNEKITLHLKNNKILETRKEPNETFSELVKNYQISPQKIENIDIKIKGESSSQYWMDILAPFLIPFLLIGLFIWLMMRQVQGVSTKAMMFGKSGARKIVSKNKKNKVTFKDVAGVKEAKEELKEIVEFLKQPKKFHDLGARIPRGALLIGQPGTGKTLLARAVAGEAEVPFFHISGSEFVEMFVGVGASRVRDLFKKAKKNAPCIIFIDELDAVGRQRGSGFGGSHDEREQTLNQILVEMDGFDPHDNVIVLSATNRPDVLDPALLRPGRFDRRIIVDMPDIASREAILKIHSQGKSIAKDINFRKIAERTTGFSGADLANLLNESAILSVRRKKKVIEMKEILDSVEKVLLGPERKSYILSKQEKKITAYHEAGHAVVAHFLPHTDPVNKISIIARGKAAGYTIKVPERERKLQTKKQFIEELSVLLGGWVAEKEFFGEVTTGASSDLNQATKLARLLITEYGMSSLGPISFEESDKQLFLGGEIGRQKNYSEKTAERIDEQINIFITNAQKVAQTIIIKKKEKIENLVRALIEKETIEREEFERIMA